MNWTYQQAGNDPASGFYIEDEAGTIGKIYREENARMVAAAPDLLEAMENLFKECAMIHKYGGEIYNQKEADAAIAAAKAAIAKAKGEPT